MGVSSVAMLFQIKKAPVLLMSTPHHAQHFHHHHQHHHHHHQHNHHCHQHPHHCHHRDHHQDQKLSIVIISIAIAVAFKLLCNPQSKEIVHLQSSSWNPLEIYDLLISVESSRKLYMRMCIQRPPLSPFPIKLEDALPTKKEAEKALV